MKILERIQERFTKMIVGCRDKSYAQRLMQHGLTTLEERYDRAGMLLVYKIMNDSDGIYLQNFLLLNERPGRKTFNQII